MTLVEWAHDAVENAVRGKIAYTTNLANQRVLFGADPFIRALLTEVRVRFRMSAEAVKLLEMLESSNVESCPAKEFS